MVRFKLLGNVSIGFALLCSCIYLAASVHIFSIFLVGAREAGKFREALYWNWNI